MRVLPFLTVLMFGGPLQAATTCVFTQLNTIGDEIILLNQERGYTFMVIEHDMDFIGCRCDPVICMAKGRVLAQRTLDEIQANEQVIEAYLGKGLKNEDKVGA